MTLLSTPRSTTKDVAIALQTSKASTRKERLFQLFLLFSTLVGLVILVVLLVDIVVDGFSSLDLGFFTDYTSRRPEDTGIRAGLTGTLSLMVLVALIAFPIGVGSAIYLESFAPRTWFTRFMQLNITNLAGVPSVVYGLLAAALFAYILNFGRTLITGALALVLLILPVIIVAGKESIKAVPPSIYQGAIALGATPWQAVYKQVLPVAMPGILTGTILALSRAIGEAAPILVAGAVFSRRADSEPWNLTEPFAALPVQIFDFVKRPQEAFQVEVAAAGILVMLFVLLLMNSAAIVLRNRYSK
ncbi:MAG: phosphate ABC transporter permease PstA [Actinomycetota bacterium]|nr:phosphate ABC transporter permease PstA [Actinomycetota bacterium]MDA3026587.1 phosphate ABC transporter permease PstA [Actinomycetota bacterium]